MPKGDFNLDDNYNDYNSLNNSIADEHPNNFNLGQNADLSNIGINKNQSNNVIDDSSVVFEDPSFETGSEKLKYFMSTLNKKLLILIGIILAVIICVLIVIFAIISKINASYKAEVNIPELIYMGETADVDIVAKGKKNLNHTVTTFNFYKYNIEDNDFDSYDIDYLKSIAEEEGIPNYKKLNITELRDALYTEYMKKLKFEKKDTDNLTISPIDSKVIGKNTSNTLIPMQEGRTIIEVESKLGNKNMAHIKKRITVCPAFNTELVLGEKISVIKDSNFDLKINFGIGNCSEGITYSSSNEEIFKVSEKGEIEGIEVGEAILTITKDSRSFSVPVYVTKKYIDFKSGEFTPKQLQLVPGQNIRMKLNYQPFNATSENLSFSSSNEEIVNVDSYGMVTAIKEGKAIITSQVNYTDISQDIEVVVSKQSSGGVLVTDLQLEKKEISMIKGSSYKINYAIIPQDAGDKNLKFKTADKNIATVNSKGIIYGHNAGKTVISVVTSNNIKKDIQVTVNDRKEPVITASDKITSNRWHNKKFTLSISGGDSGSNYYYGTSENKITTKGSKIVVDKDTNTTYYVKSCFNKICSNASKYVALLDTTKPIVTVALSSNNSASIAMKDATSMVREVCVTDNEEYKECSWKSITPSKNSVVKYNAKRNGTFYVFAKDQAGNISDAKIFNITGVE